MGKLTRYGFLVAAAAALVTATNVLVGCGANTDENTPFRGAYAGNWRVQRVGGPVGGPVLDPQFTGSLSVTMDAKGEMVGSVTNVLGTTFRFDGDVDEDRTFEGTMSSGATVYRFEGVVSEQPVTIESIEELAAAAGVSGDSLRSRQEATPSPSPSPTPTPSPSSSTGTGDNQGLSGDFKFFADGVEYRGSLDIRGGVTISQ